MATRNLVPQADKEGGIGTSLKRWLNGYFRNLFVVSDDSTDGTARITLGTYERAVHPTHYGEVVRLDMLSEDAKPAIAFRDKFTDSENPATKAWLLCHEYLQYTSASYTKSFTDAEVNTTSKRITITGHGFTSGQQVKLWNIGGALPGGIAYVKNYYIKVIDANTIELYRDSGQTILINIATASGGGTHYMANTTLGNNIHRHSNIEVSDSTGAVQTRLEFLYDMDTSLIRTASAHFVVQDGNRIYLVGDNASNKEIRFGIDETDVYTRWSLRQDTTTESGTNEGSDFKIVRYSDAGVAQDNPIAIKRSNGYVVVGGAISDATSPFTVASDRIRVKTAKTPASAGATGVAGEIAWDSSYIYVCVATNTWKRVAIATW